LPKVGARGGYLRPAGGVESNRHRCLSQLRRRYLLNPSRQNFANRGPEIRIVIALNVHIELSGALAGPDRLADVVDAFVGARIGRQAAEALLMTPRWAMAAALHVIDDQHGGIQRYLRGGWRRPFLGSCTTT
jgi:hypothetical protein